MNDIEQHVTSLEMSQKLAEVGLPVDDGLAWWCAIQGEWKCLSTDAAAQRFGEIECSLRAYTASELGQMLPTTINRLYVLEGYRAESGVWVIYYRDRTLYGCETMSGTYVEEKHEADARAALLLKLIEAGHVDPNALNAETMSDTNKSAN